MMNIIHPNVQANKEQLHQTFQSADFFPHVGIENFFTAEICHRLAGEFPTFKEENAVNELGHVGLKAWQEKVRSLGETFRLVDDVLQTPEFLGLVSDITGIPDLLYDPYYIGGGTHENLHDGELDIHVDFNYHPKTGWHRRLNLIVFLNDEWNASWGGNFEVHDDPWNPEKDEFHMFPPLFNHAVIFETNERSWHGFDKICLPEDKRHLSRKSFAIYLYTEGRPADEVAPSHATVYVPRPIPSHLAPGHTLTEADMTHLKNLVNKRDDQIHFLYEREKELAEISDQAVELMRRNRQLENQLESLENPFLKGTARFIDPPDGVWKDRWAGDVLEGRIRAKEKTRTLSFRGFVPDFFPGSRKIQITAGNVSSEQEVTQGAFEFRLDLDLDPKSEIDFRVAASETVRPSAQGMGDDHRELAFQLVSIDAS